MTDSTSEVRAAAARLMEAFSSGDEEGYFDCFHPDATFLFHGVDPIGSRDDYRALVRSWKDEHGFQVLSSTSLDADVAVFGDAAVLTHRVTTTQRWDGEEATLQERESIVFQRQPDGAWLAIHEHLASDETA
ncbi:MAG: YybH family protein [Actinomycetota bacterium]